MKLILAPIILSLVAASKTGDDHPTLPTRWSAITDEPGMGEGKEEYLFEATPSVDSPSAMWSEYPGCSRLIHITSNADAVRYLLGCDAVNCCKEQQDGNQVEFQIPNVRYKSGKKADVSYARVNITNFGETVEVDEWSWSWEVNGKALQSWKAHTLDCDDCVNGVRLVQWSSSAAGSPYYPIQFKHFEGYEVDPTSEFEQSFAVPEVCQGNILNCDSELSKKYN
mmetsp:Transcript_19650/g.41080  ORF Transcript_19650/g.41080 Transcript_19650/m.41080 type:complete len:224 (+) Transcript_19650:2-673(+)